MSPAQLFFMASYISEPWETFRREYEGRNKRLALYGRTRAVVVFDRVLNYRTAI